MSVLRRQALAWIGISLVTLAAEQAFAQPGPPFGRGRGRGGDPQFVVDRDVFHFLLSNHDRIRRRVTPRADGVETLTESDKPEIAAKIQEHVAAMHRRVTEVRPIHVRDPLFAELFRHARQIEMKIEKTKEGVRVVETSKDPYVATLIQAHAQVVDGFVKNGFEEARKDHAIPDADAAAAKPADEPNAVAAVPGGTCVSCADAISEGPACQACPNAASCAAGKTCPDAAEAGCKACPKAAAAGPACQACPNAASCAAGKSCPDAAEAGCKTCPKSAAANPACQACPNAASCATGKTCPDAVGTGCGSCPFSSQSGDGAAGPSLKPEADAPPPLNQGARKS